MRGGVNYWKDSWTFRSWCCGSWPHTETEPGDQPREKKLHHDPVPHRLASRVQECGRTCWHSCRTQTPPAHTSAPLLRISVSITGHHSETKRPRNPETPATGVIVRWIKCCQNSASFSLHLLNQHSVWSVLLCLTFSEPYSDPFHTGDNQLLSNLCLHRNNDQTETFPFFFLKIIPPPLRATTLCLSEQVTGLTEPREEFKHTHLLVPCSTAAPVGSVSAVCVQADDGISECDPNTHLLFSQEEEEEWVSGWSFRGMQPFRVLLHGKWCHCETGGRWCSSFPFAVHSIFSFLAENSSLSLCYLSSFWEI